MKNSNNNKRLRIYDFTKDGKGISKREPLNPSGLKRFFLTYKNNFGKLILVNMIMVLGNFPALFLVAVLAGFTKNISYLPLNDIGQNLSSLFMLEEMTPAQMSLYALEGMNAQIYINTTMTYVFIGIGALFLFTFGVVNAGTAYVLRNIAMGEPVFVWGDFWYAVKRNYKQAIPFGIIDGIINAVLIFNLYTTVTSSDFLVSMMFWSNVVLFILYFFMRCYIYVQMVTFDLTVFKILKNALIFSLLGLKRNILAFLGTAVMLALEIFFLFFPGGVLLPLAVAVPLIMMFSGSAYMKVYASYFKIKEIIIDPYKAEHPELYEENTEDEIIMHDDVSEKERLEEIKKKNNM
ncbi:MAG: DUF624 domain-containing protein [Clostridia bacterium]|nr:DUF624 domain-containing protein [Clostridia bacterium]